MYLKVSNDIMLVHLTIYVTFLKKMRRLRFHQNLIDNLFPVPMKNSHQSEINSKQSLKQVVEWSSQHNYIKQLKNGNSRMIKATTLFLSNLIRYMADRLWYNAFLGKAGDGMWMKTKKIQPNRHTRRNMKNICLSM